jgi:predicted ATPase
VVSHKRHGRQYKGTLRSGATLRSIRDPRCPPNSQTIYWNRSPLVTIILVKGDTQLRRVVASIVNEFRENAEECIGWAQTARSDRERQIFLQMAEAWMEAAARREHPHVVVRPELEDGNPPDSSRVP